MNDELIKMFLNLYSNPIFKDTFAESMLKMQKEGMDAARAFWIQQSQKEQLLSGITGITGVFDKMMDFYSDMGFVSRKKYDEALKENEKLKRENEFLKDTIQKLNLKVFEEGGKTMQEAWKDTVSKQMEFSKEITKNLFDLFKKDSSK